MFHLIYDYDELTVLFLIELNEIPNSEFWSHLKLTHQIECLDLQLPQHNFNDDANFKNGSLKMLNLNLDIDSQKYKHYE